MVNSFSFPIHASGASWHIELCVHRARTNSEWVKHHNVGAITHFNATTITQAVQTCGLLGEVVHRFFQIHKFFITYSARNERGRESETIDHVEVSTCIACTHNGTLVAPHFNTALPCCSILTFVLVGNDRAQIVIDDNVDQQVPWLNFEFFCNVANETTSIFLPLVGKGFKQDVCAPVTNRASRTLCALCQAIHFFTALRVAHHGELHIVGKCH
ncbi:unannotated protein [freshwater metagenome]|uniref:Unannotated protein n=1 Tax=freshwater metagenome TaxID=449393 RepID=A0A6J7QYQ6_9ZZZZ